MSRRDCDLEALLQFQQKTVEFCQEILQLGIQLSEKADEAANLLRDEASSYSLDKIYNAATEITKVGADGQLIMSQHVSETQKELAQWQTMQ